MSDGIDGNSGQDTPELLIPRALDPERKRGIFTKTDRQYLAGKLDLEGQEKYNLQYRLRQRVINSLLDMALLRRLSTNDLEKIMEEVPHFDHDGRLFTHDLKSQSTLLTYILEFAVRYAYESNDTENIIENIEDSLENAITLVNHPQVYPPHGYGEYQGAISDVSVTIEIEEGPSNLDELRNKLLDPDFGDPNFQAYISEYVEKADRDDVERLSDKMEKEGMTKLSAYLVELFDEANDS